MDVPRREKHLVHKLGQAGFDTNYIIYRNVETIPPKKSFRRKNVKETWESFLPYYYYFFGQLCMAEKKYYITIRRYIK